MTEQQLQTVQQAIQFALSPDKTNHELALLSMLNTGIDPEILTKILLYLNCINEFCIADAHAMLILQDFRNEIQDRNLMMQLIKCYKNYSVELNVEQIDFELMKQIGLLGHSLKREIFDYKIGCNDDLIAYMKAHKLELSEIYYDAEHEAKYSVKSNRMFRHCVTEDIFNKLASDWQAHIFTITNCFDYVYDRLIKCRNTNERTKNALYEYCVHVSKETDYDIHDLNRWGCKRQYNFIIDTLDLNKHELGFGRMSVGAYQDVFFTSKDIRVSDSKLHLVGKTVSFVLDKQQIINCCNNNETSAKIQAVAPHYSVEIDNIPLLYRCIINSQKS